LEAAEEEVAYVANGERNGLLGDGGRGDEFFKNLLGIFRIPARQSRGVVVELQGGGREHVSRRKLGLRKTRTWTSSSSSRSMLFARLAPELEEMFPDWQRETTKRSKIGVEL
jgi:hypothetical protein